MKKEIFSAFFLFLFLFLLTPALGDQKKPLIQDGVLDLSQWDFEKDGAVRLDGAWNFYWEKLSKQGELLPQGQGVPVHVPSRWNNYKVNDKEIPSTGYATYQLLVRMPPGERLYSVRVRDIATSFDLFADEKQIAGKGVVASTPEESLPRVMSDFGVFRKNGGDLLITIHVSNFHHNDGGIWQSLKLGTFEQIADEDKLFTAFDLFQVGAILIVGLHYLGIYLFRRKEKPFFLFGVICSVSVFRILFLESRYMLELFSWMPWEVGNKINYITFCLLPALYVMFITELFPDRKTYKITRFFQFTALLGILLVLATKAIIYTQTRYLFQANILLACIYSMYVIYRAFREKQSGAQPLLFCGIALILMIINDLLHSNYLIETGYFSGFGLMIFFVAISYILTRKFAVAFNLVEDKNLELGRIHLELEEKNKKLSTLDQLKDEFLANTSHELKTPLHGMIGIAESIRDLPFSEDVKKKLQLIISSGKRLSNLVQGILDFSRAKEKALTLNKQDCHLHNAVSVTGMLLEPLISNPEELVLENRVPENIFVSADEARLQQILHNLIGNAIKFTESGAIILSAIMENDMVCFSVKDTGKGVPEEQRQDIFDAYTTLDGTSGTGLGLAVTRQLIELHGGSIRMESDESGSEFFIRLPGSLKELEKIESEEKVEDTMDDAEAPLIVDRDVHDITVDILVVDDEPVNRQIIESQLSSFYNIRSAHSGAEALKQIETKKPDLILLDVMMPGMTGFEVCEKIRENYSDKELPIIFLTVLNQVNDLIQGFSAGGNDYLTKPFGRDELIVRVRNQLKLVNTKSRLETLREVSGKINEFQDIDDIFELTLNVLKSDRLISSFSLLKNEKVLFEDGQDVGEQPDIQEGELVLSEGEDTLFQAKIFDDYQLLCRLEGEDENLEFLRTLINQIRMKRESLQQESFEDTTPEQFRVYQLLKRISYIQAERQYCKLCLEDGEEEMLRIGLKGILEKISEPHLIQVHRSYLVNPKKVTAAVKNNKRGYDLFGKNIKLTVSSGYVAGLKQCRPDLFE